MLWASCEKKGSVIASGVRAKRQAMERDGSDAEGVIPVFRLRALELGI